MAQSRFDETGTDASMTDASRLLVRRRAVLRRVGIAAATVAAIASAWAPASAQERPAMDLAGGYSRLHEQGEGVGLVDTYERGWFVSGARRLGTSRFLFVGHVDRHQRENFVGEPQSRTAVLGGLRVSLLDWTRLSTFAQSAGGWERFFEPGIAEDGFALQSGAGVDVRIWLSLAARVQGDYRFVRQNGGNYTDWRAGVGAVVLIGR
jgi:hypothetical protein